LSHQLCAGASNKSAASSLRERLAAQKAKAGPSSTEEVKGENVEGGTEGAAANGSQGVNAEEDEDRGHAGHGVLLGKRDHEEDACTPDKVSKQLSDKEGMSVDGDEPPAKRVSGAKEEDDSVMAMWSELTDEPNAHPAEEDIPGDDDAAAQVSLERACKRVSALSCVWPEL
jgi:hypothetical protein